MFYRVNSAGVRLFIKGEIGFGAMDRGLPPWTSVVDTKRF